MLKVSKTVVFRTMTILREVMVLWTGDFAHEVRVTCRARGQNFIKTVLLVLSVQKLAWPRPGFIWNLPEGRGLMPFSWKFAQLLVLTRETFCQNFEFERGLVRELWAKEIFWARSTLGRGADHPDDIFTVRFLRMCSLVCSEQILKVSCTYHHPLWSCGLFPSTRVFGQVGAGVGQFWLAREVGGLRLKRYRPLRVKYLCYDCIILTER